MKTHTPKIGITGPVLFLCAVIFAAAPTLAGDQASLFGSFLLNSKTPMLIAKKDADAPKKEIPTYEKAMRDAVNQFLAVVESIDKKNQPREWKLKQIYQFNQSVKWGPDAQFTYYVFDEQMRLLDCVDFRQFVGKDFYEWTDTSGRKAFQSLHKGILQKGLETVELNWAIPKGLFPVPSRAHGQPYKPLNILVVTIVGEQYLTAFEEPFKDLQQRILPDPPENRPRKRPPPPGTSSGKI